MTRQAVWNLLLVIAVNLLADCSMLFAQSAPAATTKSVQQSRAQANQKTQGGDNKFNAAIVELNEKIRRDPGNPEPHYARAYLEHKAGRVNDAQKSILVARGLEPKRPIADWGRIMERYQGPSRVWLEEARRKPVEELLTPEPLPPEPVVASAPKTSSAAGSGRESQPTTTVPKIGDKPNAPKNAAPTLGFIGAINDQQQLTMFGMGPSPAEEVITQNVLVNGKQISVTEKKPITIFHRVVRPVPLSSVLISNVAGERLTEEQIRDSIKRDTLVLMSPQTVDPRYLKLVKPDTLIVTKIAADAVPVPGTEAAPPPPAAPAPAPNAQAPAPTTGPVIAASCGEADELASAREEPVNLSVPEVVRPPSPSRTSNQLSRTPSSHELGYQFFGDEFFGRARVPILRAVDQAHFPIAGETVAMLWDSAIFDPARFPIEAPPVMVFATGLDDNRTLTTVGSVFEHITRTVAEFQVDPDGREVWVAFRSPEEQRRLKPVTHILGGARFFSLKAAVVSKGGHGDPLTLSEARRRIGQGAAVLLAYCELPDPRYLSLFRDDTLLIVSRRHTFLRACTPTVCVVPPPTVAAPAAQGDAHIPQLIAQLKHVDSNLRNQAAYALSSIGPWAKPAVPALTESLKDELSRASALLALKKIGSSASAAVPAVTELLEHDEELVQLQAADALCEIDLAVAKVAVPVVLECLKSEQDHVRYGAAEVLLRLAPDQSQKAVPVLLEQLKSSTGYSTFFGGTSFSSMEPHIGKALVPALLDALKHPQQPKEAQPRVGVETVPAPLPEPVDPSVAKLQDIQRRVCMATVIAQFAPDHAAVVVPILMEGLSSTGPMGAPMPAATALLSLVADFDSARDILLNDLRPGMFGKACAPTGAHGKDSGDAAQAIALLHGEPADVAEARQLLLDKLRRDTPQERYQTFSGWSECRLAGKEVLLSILKEFEQDDDEIIQAVAKSAAAKIKSTPATPRPTSARPASAETSTGVRTRVIRPITPPPGAAPVRAPAPEETPPPPKVEAAPAPKA